MDQCVARRYLRSGTDAGAKRSGQQSQTFPIGTHGRVAQDARCGLDHAGRVREQASEHPSRLMTVLADDDNGVLAKIPAEYIGRALDLMPNPQTASGSRGRERTATMTRFNVRKFLAYRLLALAVGLQLPLAAIAEEGVMFENVPLALDKASALA